MRVARCCSVRRNREELSPPAASRRRRGVAISLVGHEHFAVSEQLYLQRVRCSVEQVSELGSFGTAAGSTATFQLASRGGYLIWPTKNELAAVESGYATLDCSSPVVAQVVFASFDGLGVTAAATVFSAQAATVFQFPVLTPAATLGFAIANDTNAEASCRILLEDYQRTNLGEATLSVPAKSNRAQMLTPPSTLPGNIPRRVGDRFVQSAGRDDRTAFRAATGRNDHHLQHAATGDSLRDSGRYWGSMEPTRTLSGSVERGSSRTPKMVPQLQTLSC